MPVNNPRHSRFFWRSSGLFGILDFERQFKEVNAAWEKVLGLTTGQLLAKRFLDFVHPEDQPSTQYYFDQLDTGLPSVSFSNRYRHHDGSYRHILWEINGAASVEYAFYAVGMDITAREQPMVADEMISVLQEGVVLQYANGTIGACNPSAERILGISAEQMMGWTLIDPDWRTIREDNSPFPAETHPAICTLRTGQSYADVVMGIVKSDESVTWIRVNSYPLWRDDVTTPYAVVISFSDITHYKETEQALRKDSDRSTSNIASDNNYDLWDWDLASHEVNFSPRWKKMLGYEEHELNNHIDTWHQRIHPADYKRVMADIQNHIDGLTQVCENTHRLQHKDGNYRWVLNRSVMVRDASGKPQHMVGTHVDITEPRRIEEELQETEKKYRQLMEVETDAVFLLDADSLEILDSNKTASQLYGYTRNQLLQMKALNLSAQPERMAKVMKKGIKLASQQYHKKQDETVFPVEVVANPFVWKGRQVLMTAIRDTSERQRVETALWENESKYRQLFEAASNPTIVFDANTQQVFDVNRAAIDLYGYSKEEWLHMTTEDVSAEPSKGRGAFNSSNKKVQVIPLRWHKKKDGSVFPVEISAGNTYLFQGRSLICATLRDITERKAAEEALRKERDFINTLVQASPAFFCAIDPDGKTRMMNKAMLHSLEYELEEVVNADYLMTVVPEQERSFVAQEFESLIKTMQPSLMESHVLSKSGKHLLVEWHSRAIVKANGALDYLFAVGIDVTERKKAQGHLRLFKSIVENSQESIVISNIEGQLVYANPAYERLFGRELKDLNGLINHDIYPASALGVLENEAMFTIKQGHSWEGELEGLDRDGNPFPIWQRFDAVRDSHGNAAFIFGLMHDISERKRMWETLRRQWEEQQMIFNAVPAMIWYRDENNHLVRSNKLALELFGKENEQIQKYTDCSAVIRAGESQYGMVQAYHGDEGEIRWLSLDKILYRDSQGNIIGVIVFGMDITEHKQTQATLQASEERMYLVVENMPIMLNAFDTEGNIVMWNRMSEEITGYPAHEIVGNAHALEMLYPDTSDRNRMLTKWHSLDGNDNTWETRLLCKDGHIKNITWCSVAKQFPIPSWYAWHIGQSVSISSKPTLNALRDSDNLSASTVDSTKLGICLTDDRGRFLQVNRAYADLYGYRAEELVGQPFTLVLPLNTHNDAVRDYYSLLMTHEEPTMVKHRTDQHRNGTTFEVHVLSSRVILEDKRRMMLTIVSRIFESKRLG